MGSMVPLFHPNAQKDESHNENAEQIKGFVVNVTILTSHEIKLTKA